MAQLWRNWDIFGKVVWHHSPGFNVPSEALETTKFTFVCPMARPIEASYLKLKETFGTENYVKLNLTHQLKVIVV